ncbi:MAG: hypothetical protein ACLFNK_05140, partial [Candidatus Woesearchaeota archaeon]
HQMNESLLSKKNTELSTKERELKDREKILQKEVKNYHKRIEKLEAENQLLKKSLNEAKGMISGKRWRSKSSDEVQDIPSEPRRTKIVEEDSGSRPKHAKPRMKYTTVEDYIRTALANGFPKKHIEDKLVSVGWKPQQVKRLFKRLKT